MKPTCYLCDKTFDDVLVKKHDEHVLQNSIGGKLTSREILCEGCGAILGDSVDSAFARDLSPISVLFDVVRDRGQPQKATVNVVANCAESALLESVRFQLGSDFSITPTKPIHIKDEKAKRVLIFAATSKQAKQYEQSPNISKFKAEGFKIVEGGNVADQIQELVLRVDVGSATLLRGMLKIAIGFAAYHGVSRAIMAHLFIGKDLINDHSALSSIIFQYYPTTNEEKLFEIEKSGHEDWFPNHQIYLFSRGENLFCYLEIFGVIQKYIHLSNCYSGSPIREKYLQRAERWEFNEKAFLARTTSDLDILARQFEVEIAGRQWEDIQAEITHRAKTRAYALDPDNQIEKVSHLMRLLVQFSMLKTPENSEVATRLLAKARKANSELGLSLLDDLTRNPMNALQTIRADYSGFRIGSSEHFCPFEVRKVQDMEVRKYVAYKFYDLLRGCGREDWLRYEVA